MCNFIVYFVFKEKIIINMRVVTFKTNIKCNNCLEKVRPFLEQKKEIKDWNINLSDPERTLSVTTENLTDQQIIELIKEAGFEAETKKASFFAKIFK